MARKKKNRNRKKKPSPPPNTTTPRPNDVLLGRGTGPNQFWGNQQFRSLVTEFKDDYVSTNKQREKEKIAQNLMDHVHSLGGRFLRQAEDGKKEDSNDIVTDGVWYEAPPKVSLERCKQSLRQKPHTNKKGTTKKTRKKEVSKENEQNDERKPAAIRPREVKSGATESLEPLTTDAGNTTCDETAPTPLPPSSFSPILPSMIATETGGCIQDASLSLFQPTPALHPFQFNQTYPFNSCTPMGGYSSTDSLPPTTTALAFQQQYGTSNVLSSHAPYLLVPQPQFIGPSETLQQIQSIGPAVNTDEENMGLEAPKEDPPNGTVEEDVSEYLLSVLSLSGRTTITEEEEEEERAGLTDEEKASVLCDMLGHMCNVGTPKPNKRARRDLDRDSIEFLVRQMRLELEGIPNDEKRALMEAQSKCHREEFSDERIVTFLRCEGMNAKLAAQRFVNYWERRKEVFGAQKYVMRMTLSEALCDDLVALEAGVYLLLPHADTSGRKLLYWEPHRHTRQGYTSESLRRAIWYTIECASKENNEIGSGIVQILWERDTTLWDYDNKMHDCIASYLKSCWPVKMISTHICCPPRIPVRFLKPIIHAILGKEMRSRVQLHDVPKTDIAQILCGFGILKDMLPTHMGGTVVLNQREWIASRRAAEMEQDSLA